MKPIHETVAGIVRTAVAAAEQYREPPAGTYESWTAQERRKAAAKEAALAILRAGDVVILYRTSDTYGHGVNPLGIMDASPKEVWMYLVSENAKETYGHTSTLEPWLGDFRLRREAEQLAKKSEASTDKTWNKIMRR